MFVLTTTSFGPQIFCRHFEQHKSSLPYPLFVWQTVLSNFFLCMTNSSQQFLSNGHMYLYGVEQCSATNRVSTASTCANFLSLVSATQKFVLFALGKHKRFFDLVWVLFAPSMPSSSHVSLWFVQYYCKLRSRLLLSQQGKHRAKY